MQPDILPRGRMGNKVSLAVGLLCKQRQKAPQVAYFS